MIGEHDLVEGTLKKIANKKNSLYEEHKMLILGITISVIAFIGILILAHILLFEAAKR